MRRIKPKSIENEMDLVNSQPGDIMLVVTPDRKFRGVVYEGEENGRYLFREHKTGCDFVYRSGLESLRFLIASPSPNQRKRIGVILFENPYSLYYIERRETK